MDAAKRGSDFDDFVLSHSPRLLRVAYLLTGDAGTAEDLLQDVLERLYVVWPRVQDPLPYARRSLANAATNRWRRRGLRREVPFEAGHDVALADATETGAERDRVVRALQALPGRQRAVIVLRFYDDLTEMQTAEALGCSPGTVKSHTSRAIARLRTLLSPDLVADLVPGRTP